MKHLLHSTTLVLALVFASPAGIASPPADAPSAAQVEALLDAMELEVAQKAMLDQLGASTHAMGMAGLGEDPDAEDLARMERFNAEQRAFMAEVMQSDHTRNAYRIALRETMTAAEVEAMTAFYRSPAGRSAMRKMPAMMGVAMREMQPAMMEMVARFSARLDAELKRGADGDASAPASAPAPAD